MIQKRKRKELYDKFRQGAIPSGADFADLIRSQVNLLDDGIDISEDAKDPVSLRAHGDDENLLDFADANGKQRWRITGRSEESSKEGLNITADYKSKVYLERETGNVGINNDQPKAKLHLIQTDSSDAFRIDDEANDATPFIVNSDGQVGIGIPEPKAKLHINYPGVGDIFRIDDTNEDITPLVVDDQGNIGIGCDKPAAKITLMAGGLSIGQNNNPGANNLYVQGNIEVGGTVVLSGSEGVGGIQFNAPLTSKTDEVVIRNNLKVIANPGQTGSHGNLRVQGDTVLGSFSSAPANYNILTVNGRIRSGNNPETGEEQYLLDLNESLTVSRDSKAQQVTVKGSLTVNGITTLGSAPTDNIYLNGKVGSKTGVVTIDNDLSVSGNTTLGDSATDKIYLNGRVSSNTGALSIEGNLNVSGNTTLGDSATDSICLNGNISSGTGSLNITSPVNINNNLNITGCLTFKSGTQISGIATAVSSANNGTLTTEAAVKSYVDSMINSVNNSVNDVRNQIPKLVKDVRYSATTAGGGCDSYIDMYPPANFTMGQLVYFSVSIRWIAFNGDVDNNDTMACWAEELPGICIRCHVGNSEQRQASAIAFYGLWRA